MSAATFSRSSLLRADQADVDALLGKHPADRLADAPACPCDDCRPAFEPKIHPVLRCVMLLRAWIPNPGACYAQRSRMSPSKEALSNADDDRCHQPYGGLCSCHHGGLLPAAVRREALRTFVNIFGCTVGGSRHEAVAITGRALLPFAGEAQATLIGRGRKSDILTASLINCLSSSVYTFDDTHAEAIVHPERPGDGRGAGAGRAPAVHGRDLLTPSRSAWKSCAG